MVEVGTQAVVYGPDGTQYGNGMIAERAGVTDYAYAQPSTVEQFPIAPSYPTFGKPYDQPDTTFEDSMTPAPMSQLLGYPKDEKPKYKIDKGFYESPEYKNMDTSRPAGQAFTYSPYFGMSPSGAITYVDEAYKAYAKRMKFNPNIDYAEKKTGNTNMAANPVTNIQDTVEERAGLTELPEGTTYTPKVQEIQYGELLQNPDPLSTNDKVTPSLVATADLDVTVPTKQNAETYSANTIDGTPEAIAAKGKLSSESIIGDIQGAVSKESLVTAAKGTVSEEATVKYQLGELFSSFEEGKPLPAWAAPAVRNVGAMMQARGLGASSMASAAITQAIMESGIPIAKADADRYGQMDMANLTNQQQSVMQNAMTYASMDKANLDVRMQVAANNAKSFLSMDLQNLSNEEKMKEIDYAGQLQTLTSNQAAENSAQQFNAQSQNQIDEFFAELGGQLETGNKNRKAAQDQFNVSEINAIAQYNASVSDQRERFNIEMATQISQANAVWRREINTAETANINAANQMNAQNLLGITQASLDALWQRYRDEAGWALKIAEGQEQRFHEIGLLGMEIDSNTDLYEMESDATFSTELGKAILNGVFKVGNSFINS